MLTAGAGCGVMGRVLRRPGFQNADDRKQGEAHRTQAHEHPGGNKEIRGGRCQLEHERREEAAGQRRENGNHGNAVGQRKLLADITFETVRAEIGIEDVF